MEDSCVPERVAVVAEPALHVKVAGGDLGVEMHTLEAAAAGFGH
jgi:hypothetical protein